MIRRALERDLPLAEEVYAGGLLVESTPAALGHSRRAVQLDTSDPRANGMLALLLTLSGCFPEAPAGGDGRGHGSGRAPASAVAAVGQPTKAPAPAPQVEMNRS
jgi:hypothetical protein